MEIFSTFVTTEDPSNNGANAASGVSGNVENNLVKMGKDGKEEFRVTEETAR